MVRFVAGCFALLLTITAAPAALAQTATCNPYTQACLTTPGGTPFPNPYETPQQGPYVGLGPYAPPAEILAHAAQRWTINGDVFIDVEQNRYGWLIISNLADSPQTVIVEYTSEGWAFPAYHILEVHKRGVISLHDETVLRGGLHVSAHVYFAQPGGSVYATFRPDPLDNHGQHDVGGMPIPATCSADGTR